MTLTHGGDTERMRAVATQLAALGRQAGDCGAHVRHSAGVLEMTWQGPDSTHFVQAAHVSSDRLEETAEALRLVAERLVDQAEQQDAASQGGTGAGGGAPAGVVADNNDARDKHWWDQRKKNPQDFETSGDPGPNIQMPKGLDPNSQLAKDLMATPQGRETLDWMRRNNIAVKYDKNKAGAWYDPGSNTMTFGVDDPKKPESQRRYNDSPGTLIHEANHARWDAEDRGLDIDHKNREEYAQSQVDEEIAGQEARWRWNEQARQNGINVPMGADEQAWRAARAGAQANGQAQDQVDKAGHDEVQKMFEGKHPTINYTQSTDGKNYYDRHRADWDDRHDGWPWW